MPMEPKFIPTTKQSKIPGRATKHAAGYDLYALGNYPVGPGQRTWVGTGVTIELQRGTFGLILPRSGTWQTLGVFPGVIDSDFREHEVKVGIINNSGVDQYIQDGEAVAQLVVLPLAYAGEANAPERKGGFGSTDKSK